MKKKTYNSFPTCNKNYNIFTSIKREQKKILLINGLYL